MALIVNKQKIKYFIGKLTENVFFLIENNCNKCNAFNFIINTVMFKQT